MKLPLIQGIAEGVTLAETKIIRLSRFNYLLLLLLVGIPYAQLNATHIKAADLYAKVNPNNSKAVNAHRIVRFTLNVFCDKQKVEISEQSSASDVCERRLGNCTRLAFGDGSSQRVGYNGVPQDVGNNTLLFVYYFDHVYPSDNFYIPYYSDENRNDNILNLKGPTNLLGFYIEMGILIESALSTNQTPQLSIPPVDIAEQFRTFIHNPGAYDVDGDSVSYKPYYPQIPVGTEAPGYLNPNSVAGGKTQDGSQEATYSVNPNNGDVKWDAPAITGLFNVAFIIEEWRTVGRRKERISYAIRDMQITVRPGSNRQPVIDPLPDVCIEAEEEYNASVHVNDQDRDVVSLQAYGELFESAQLARMASLTPTTNPTLAPFNKLFSWRPSCNDIRKRPYQVFLKATDVYAANPLSDIKSFFISVVGPKPKGLQRKVVDKNVVLTWLPYPCTSTAKNIEIYRKVGCGSSPNSKCVTGMPNGYELIGVVAANDTQYIDKTVMRGVVYSYAIAVTFVKNALETRSNPTVDTCIEIPASIPVITKVSFEGEAKKNVLVKWLQPIVIDTALKRPPYTYTLYRKEERELVYTLIKRFDPMLELSDTSYLDTTTKVGQTYSYYVGFEYYQDGLSTNDSSEIASSVKPTTIPIKGGIRLEWNAQTPWSNSVAQLYHYIWRRKNDETTFSLIDSVSFDSPTTFFSYNDMGTYNNDLFTVCDSATYFVTTSGSYQNQKIQPIVLQNNSYLSKNKILDTYPPLAPVLTELTYNCEEFTQTFPYKNALSWSNLPQQIICDSIIIGYNIYYSKLKEPFDFALIATNAPKSNTSYSHANLVSQAGCYAVTALDRVGNESSLSNVVCVENCMLYELPNVFTPNNSGVNDLFRPIPPSPRFVESVTFRVFNRWGAKVFEEDKDVWINWDGSGLPDGVYFYTADIRFISNKPEPFKKEMKGWIQIIR